MQAVALSREEVAQKYPEVPRLIILKIDVQRRGVAYTDRARARADENLHQMRTPMIFGYRDGTVKPCPASLLLRDGTSAITDPTPPLEYYVRLARGLHEIRARYGLYVDFDDYRRCGNHPDTDLARLL